MRARITDERTPAQRRADALGEVCRGFLDRGDRPLVAGERPHLTVTVPVEVLAGAPLAGLGPGGGTGAGVEREPEREPERELVTEREPTPSGRPSSTTPVRSRRSWSDSSPATPR